MEWTYYHDEPNQTVMAMRSDPSVHEQKDKRGRRAGWFVSSDVEITRADNVLLRPTHQWKYPVRSNPSQHFDAHYSREDVVHYFHVHHAPNLPQIDEATYVTLKAKYEAQAHKNERT